MKVRKGGQKQLVITQYPSSSPAKDTITSPSTGCNFPSVDERENSLIPSLPQNDDSSVPLKLLEAGEVAIPLCFQLCSICYTVIQMKNSRSTSAINTASLYRSTDYKFTPFSSN